MINGRLSAIARVRNIMSWNIKTGLFGLTVALCTSISGHAALANTRTGSHHHTGSAHSLARLHSHSTRVAATTRHHHTGETNVAAYSYPGHHHNHYRLAAARYRHSWLQCVPYAREVSHIQLSGNAFLWWAEASGRYARGNTPAEGAVLNFRSVRRMPLGHVAVVTAVIDNRTILVTQANWIRGTITNDVTMQDVSPNNDWTQVEVELGDTSTWGASYPTYGFIYNQPDIGTTIASTGTQSTEVAEAPKPTLVNTDAPDRNLQ